MSECNEKGIKKYNKPVRARVCGLLAENDTLLLLKHSGLGKAGFIWSPPGGGIDFGETAESALIREFLEETGLTIEVTDYLFTNEYIDEQHHAIELFFQVKKISGEMKLGTDPEISAHEQLLTEARFLTFQEIDQLPKELKHNTFQFCVSSSHITLLRGFYNFHNI